MRVYPTDITDDAYGWAPVNSTGNFNFDKHPVINNTRTYALDHAYAWIGAYGFTIFNGSGAVFRIEFTAIGSGNSTLDLWDTVVADHLADPIVHDTLDGSINIFGVVGGFWIPVEKFSLLAPYIALALTIILAVSISVAYIKIRRKQ